MPTSHVDAVGLWGFKDLTGDPTNSMCLRIRFATRVTPQHRKDMLDAIHAWMMARKMIAENGGSISPEDALKMIAEQHERGKDN